MRQPEIWVYSVSGCLWQWRQRLGYTGCRGLLLLVVSGETLALAKLNKWMGKQKTLADNQRFVVYGERQPVRHQAA